MLTTFCFCRSYEDRLTSIMKQYSDNPNGDLTELEVFTGIIHNRSGSLKQKQRDKSLKLKEDFASIASFTVSQMRCNGKYFAEAITATEDSGWFDSVNRDGDPDRAFVGAPVVPPTSRPTAPLSGNASLSVSGVNPTKSPAPRTPRNLDLSRSINGDAVADSAIAGIRTNHRTPADPQTPPKTPAQSESGGVSASETWKKDALELCWACFSISCVDTKLRSSMKTSQLYTGNGKLESFRILAAACLLKEINRYAKILDARRSGISGSGGGFVGVRGSRP
jgi:hypothetical protein